jgi:hypothetical protein
VDYLRSMPFYYYLAAGSACILVLAVILYFVPGGRIRIPAIVVCAFACLFVGIGVGVIGMYGLGYHWEREPTPKMGRSPFAGGGPPGGGEGSKKGGEGAGKKGDSKKGDSKKGGEPDARNGSEKKEKDVDD